MSEDTAIRLIALVIGALSLALLVAGYRAGPRRASTTDDTDTADDARR